jgi:hypothetical protein
MNPAKVIRSEVKQLTDLPNIGKASAEDLRVLGIRSPEQLAGKCPIELYERLCRKTSGADKASAIVAMRPWRLVRHGIGGDSRPIPAQIIPPFEAFGGSWATHPHPRRRQCLVPNGARG